MTPPAPTVAAALPGPWNRDALVARLVGLAGWRDATELGRVVAALLATWPSGPTGGTDPDGAPIDGTDETVGTAGTDGRTDTEDDDRTEIDSRASVDPAPHSVATALPDLLSGVARGPVRPETPPAAAGVDWRWPVPRWTEPDALARDLGLHPDELAWFADPGGWLRRAPDGPLHHYRRRWTTSRSGSPRLLEAPAPRLRDVQHRLARRVLGRIPVHPAAHGYVRGRSARTLAAAHTGRALLVRLDLEGFFAHVTGARVAGLLRTAGYPAPVASVLAGLLVTSTPPAVLRTAPALSVDAPPGAWEARRRLLDRLAGPHLPQGAPSSPAAANLLCHRLDRRLAGLAAATGAVYGRYADDLVFSGDGGPAGLPAHGLVARVTEIAAQEGFRVRPDKTAVLPAHHRQRVTGLVVNDPAAAPAAARTEYDALRALLHNCARTGPAAQNRAAHPAFREHLLGRIAWVGAGRPARVARLRSLFDAIAW